MKTFTLTWVQDGDYRWHTLRTIDSTCAIDIFVNAGINYLSEYCSCNSLFCNDRLIARQATYQGV